VASRPLDGQSALVTGSATRIGAHVARRLAVEGAAVAIHCHAQRKEADALAQEMRRNGATAAVVQADLSDPTSGPKLMADAAKGLGSRLTLLVNMASEFPAVGLQDLTFEGLVRNLAVDAWAPLELTRQLAAQLPKGARGSVVNFLDARIVDEDRKHVGYHFAKRMLADVTRLCAVELAPRVAVNGVAPGPTLPPKGMAADEGARLMARLRRRVVLQRTAEPEDLADAVVYLLASRVVTGQVLFVDGGRHLGRQPGG